MKQAAIFSFLLLLSFYTEAQFSIAANNRYLLKNGQPFFWLGDTAWELFHRLNREEAGRYLQHRSKQGFTVIQAVVLAELDGLHTPNAYGELPLVADDLTRPNERYFEHVDFIISKADSLGIAIGLLPTWGDKVFKDRWGKGPEIFNEANAAVYATWLANRYKERRNIIWILGGDRNPRNDADVAIWNSMGRAIQKACANKAVITFHPQPADKGSAQWFHQQPWLGFNMFQNGHCRDAAVYDKISTVYSLLPAKPVMDGEPIYEDHPVCFNVTDLGTSNAYDVRKAAYLNLFAGAHGHTYGCHDIWQMNSPKNEAINGPHFYWYDALDLPGARQMTIVRRLMESHPLTDRLPDQSLVVEANNPSAERIQATRGKDYVFVYSAAGRPFTARLGKISGTDLQAYWFDPRNGTTKDIGRLKNKGSQKFTPPTAGYGQDWILVMDDAAMGHKKP